MTSHRWSSDLAKVMAAAGWGRTAVASALGFLVACCMNACGGDQELIGRFHPNADYLLDPSTAAVTLHLDNSEFVIERVTEPFRTAAASGGTSIGVTDYPETEAFGRVEGGILSGKDHIVILDSHARQLRVFDVSGRFIEAVGRAGVGPGEFRYPAAIHLGGNGQLAAFDGLGRVTSYNITQNGIQYASDFGVDGTIFDGCIMNGLVYVHGMFLDQSQVIRVYTLHGTPVTSFAEIYPVPNRLIQAQLSRGKIACVEASGLVLVASLALPEVRAYDRNGTLMWWAAVQGFQPIELVQLRSGGSLLRVPPRGAHSTVALVASQDGSEVVLQVLFAHPNAPGQAAQSGRLQTFLIRGKEHGVTYLGDHVPRILHWSSRHVLTGETDSIPVVTLVRSNGR